MAVAYDKLTFSRCCKSLREEVIRRYAQGEDQQEISDGCRGWGGRKIFLTIPVINDILATRRTGPKLPAFLRHMWDHHHGKQGGIEMSICEHNCKTMAQCLGACNNKKCRSCGNKATHSRMSVSPYVHTRVHECDDCINYYKENYEEMLDVKPI